MEEELTPVLRFNNPSKVQLKFGDTVIRYKGSLYQVLETQGLKLLLTDGEGDIVVHSSSIHLDLGTPELGWTEAHGDVWYLERFSGSTYNQCASRKNIRIYRIRVNGIGFWSVGGTGELLGFLKASEEQVFKPETPFKDILKEKRRILNKDIAFGPGPIKPVYLHRECIGHIMKGKKKAVLLEETKLRKSVRCLFDGLEEGGFEVAFT